jgi:PAS domain S-box-containing protein
VRALITPNDSSFTLRFNTVSETMSAAVILLGWAVLIGWLFDNTTLKSVAPGLVSMKANNAVGFILLGVALWLVREEPVDRRRRTQMTVCTTAVAVLGLATLAEYALNVDLGIDQLLFLESDRMVWTSHPGRMAPTSAVNFIVLAAALQQIDRPNAHWRVEGLAFTAIFVALLGYLGSVYALELLHGTGLYTHMAVHSTAGFCLLSAGVLFARPQRGLMKIISSHTAGGTTSRSLLPAAIGIPPALAWLVYQGVGGGYFPPGFGLAVVSLASIVAFAVVVLRASKLLYRVDVDRADAEEAATRNRERFRLLVDGARDTAIFMLDAHGTVQSWNPGAERIIGYDEEEILGQHFSSFFPPEDILRGKPRLELALASANGRIEDEGWRVRKDKTRFWAHVLVTALSTDDGEIRGFAKIVRDMSERKRIEERLKTAQLQVAQAEKLESVGRLAAGVAHEVKNPLATILGGIDYLGDRPASSASDRDVLREMRRAVERANEIVVGLLDFSAPHDLELAPEHLNAIVEDTLRFMKYQTERARVSVVRDFGVGLPRVRIDRRKIAQVLVNVFLNALQAMREGGTLTVRTFARNAARIDRGERGRSVLGRRDEVAIVIEDTGTGFPDSALRKVFEPFFTTKPTGEGTGLGLTVCRAIVELHGGSIEIRNRQEGGARVTIVLNQKGDPGHVQEAFAAGR